MKSKMGKKLAILISACLVFAFTPCILLSTLEDVPVMYAHFINVGQGDASLLEFPCGAILIDTGAQDNDYVDKLIDYLNAFFAKRNDLDRTLASMFITHDHPDHIKGLEEVLNNFKVKRLIYNGKARTNEPGEFGRVLRQKNKYSLDIEAVTFEKVILKGNRRGLTDSIIDPIKCDDCDPKILVLSGGFEKNPGWTAKEYGNKNNHSLVIRIDFGGSSFLFTGDLEKDGIEKVVEYYKQATTAGPCLLDTDVYRVGHHGSYNATTAPLLDVVTPDIAIISVGKWDFGRGSSNLFTTYAYGHPRKDTLDLLTLSLKQYRNEPLSAKVAIGPRKFVVYTIRKKIYATAWDKNIIVSASLDGKYNVAINN